MPARYKKIKSRIVFNFNFILFLFINHLNFYLLGSYYFVTFIVHRLFFIQICNFLNGVDKFTIT